MIALMIGGSRSYPGPFVMAAPRRPLRASRTAPPRQVRIIGGSLRRSPLAVPDEPDLRPTPERVRETLFNWLTHLWHGRFEDKRVLDLFAGTGALGLEAASRGARQVDLVEMNRRVAMQLRERCAQLAPSTTRVHQADAASFLARAPEPYDLILIDPPFHSSWLERLMPRLHQYLTPGGLVYAESAVAPAFDGWVSVRAGKAAAVHYHLLTQENPR